MVAGNIIIDDAKIGGITPAVFTFKGRWVLCPPYTFRPTTLLAYWTGIRLWDRSIKQINPITATIITKRNITRARCISPVRIRLNVSIMAEGILATMPAKIIREIPLPTPLSVICSPSHIRNTVPDIKVRALKSRKGQPGSATTGAPPGAVRLSRVMAIPSP